jgi:hypothetical protein
MNERMRELAEQAYEYVDISDSGELFEEKFAQLIVHDILDQLTNDDALGAARIETIRGLALRYGVAR